MILTNTALLWCYLILARTGTAHAEMKLEKTFKSEKSCLHEKLSGITQIPSFSRAGLGHVHAQEALLLCPYRLKVSLEPLKALTKSYSPCPQLLHYGSVIAAVKLAEPVCSFLLLSNSSYPGHLLPALFFPVISNYLSLLPLMTSGRGSLMSL